MVLISCSLLLYHWLSIQSSVLIIWYLYAQNDISGADDAHSFDTVPFQITQNFDYVVALAASDKPTGSKIYFENDEMKSDRARYI